MDAVTIHSVRRRVSGLVAGVGVAAALLIGCQSAFADVPAVYTEVGGHDIYTEASQRTSENYLFLPASAGSYVPLETKDGWVTWSNDENGTYSSGPVFMRSSGDGAQKTIYVKVNDGTAQKLTLMRSANVNAVFFDSKDKENKGRTFVDVPKSEDHRAPGQIEVVNPKGDVQYQGDVKEIKTRGNSTNGLPKKPYQLKLDKKGDLMPEKNAGKAKKWILLAEFDDPTEMHNRTSYSSAIALGLSTTPQTESVDFYYDGEYRGTYTLTEKVEIGKTRIDINDLEDDDTGNKSDDDRDVSEHPVASATNQYGKEYHYVEGVKSPADYTGGYLLEKDDAFYKGERCWFDTSAGHFVLKSPEDASQEEVKYISEKVQKALFEASKADGDLSKYFDVESLAQTWLIEDFAKNCDYANWSSTYFSVDKGADSKIVAGPIWDHDLTFGTRRNAQGKDNAHWSQGVGYPQYAFFFNNKQFQQKLVETWPAYNNILQKGVLADTSSIDGVESINQMNNEMRATMAMNGAFWGADCASDCVKYGVRVNEDVTIYPTWQQNVDFFKKFASERYSWMSNWIKNIQPGKTAAYKITHYSVTKNGKVRRFDREVEFAPIGSKVTARPVSQEVVDTTTRYPGYVYNESYPDAVKEATVNADGTAEVTCYYVQGYKPPVTPDKPVTPATPDQPNKPVSPSTPTKSAAVKTGDKVTAKNSQGVSLKYKITSTKSKTAEVIGLSKKVSGKVNVPNTIKVSGKSYKVTKVANKAFANQKDLSKVNLPSNVTVIGKRAFWHDKKLTKVSTGKNLRCIESSAFSGAKKFKTLTIKSKKLSKKSVSHSLKGSKIKKVSVKVGSKATNKRYVKKYKKIFTKKNCGLTVSVK